MPSFNYSYVLLITNDPDNIKHKTVHGVSSLARLSVHGMVIND